MHVEPADVVGLQDGVDGRVGTPAAGNPTPMIWLYVVLAIAIGIAIWLAIIVIKWLLILAIVAAVIWLVLAWRRRLAR